MPIHSVNIAAILFASSLLILTGCTRTQTWLTERKEQVEAGEALRHENKSPQPVSAMYIAQLPDGSSKAVNMSYDGHGLARMFDATPTGGPKTIIDYSAGTITREKRNKPYTTETSAIDPFSIPPVYDALGATKAGAKHKSAGVLKGHEYHQWVKAEPDGSWEVWIDDDGGFPVYYRGTRNGQEIIWQLKNSWIDQGLQDREALFDFTKPDPAKLQPDGAHQGGAD